MRICVFCGSSNGRRPEYQAVAAELGAILAAEQIGLVYGGASVGLMGIVADAARMAGGEVIGIIPKALERREVAHKELYDLRVVETMHQRKAMMADLSDAFIALPGGIGTLEEIFEVWSWARLGQHEKACAFLNVEGFYDGLFSFLDHVVDQEFLQNIYTGMLIVESDPRSVVTAIRNYQAPALPKWISDDQR